MRTVRQQFIDRSIIRSLRDCNGYLLPRQSLIDTLGITCQPQPRPDEFDDAINYAVSQRRVSAAHTEQGTKYKITEEGLVWAQENRV